ncbi:tRNA synthetase Lys [Thermoplasma volcanium GSS1]|uniref:Lysine--tRNA ligase n=1 Tax=Thermoplasma volcanium (strain ATCC 51530 / DSM 4299 / JCM 9571 / NBRC 15438 / GSS1) TaxID=273116 RepID=SYK_THEVO|nr:lysine--tRNA ligase [Thermoplasma volcanium]Q979B8.1 RecName: Full=Lysine--tRNA ligase; AltName: Full=Lysyl-tRNA synthetase; Short=LysRS [Thermoplasma volcanium GSS1]BAB60385.1 tRNA synthetase Lys [Thermoplasma volcanium GSS1]
MFWADAAVKDLIGEQRISTGISPSGPIHVGNMREILTGDILYKAVIKRGLKSDFIYLCDDMDPLRKVYPFLDQSYSKYVGFPLKNIPSPDGVGVYSDHFLNPFIEVMRKTGIPARVIKTSDLYGNGILADAIDTVMERRSEIKDILEKITGRMIEGDFYPYEPLCEKCGRINSTSVISYKYPYAEYTCKCGHHGFADIRRAEGKMPWRIEWPAKWYALKVSIEPFGKDHGAPGGSYDTGKRIAREIFGIEPPLPLVYERIMLKGKGAMHSSTGLAIPASEIIDVMPPELLRFLIARVNPSRHIDFDPGLGLLNLFDEFERYLNKYREGDIDGDSKAIIEYSLIEKEKLSYPIDFRHLITLIQIYQKKEDILRAAMASTKDQLDESALYDEIKYAKNWLERYAPDNVKFKLLAIDEKAELSDQDRAILSKFLEVSNSMAWDSNEIHSTVHNVAKDLGIGPDAAFSTFYKVFIGKERGPRLGYFLFNLGKDFTIARIKSVLGGNS